MSKRKTRRNKDQERYDMYFRQLASKDFKIQLHKMIGSFLDKVIFWQSVTAVSITMGISIIIIMSYVK